MTISWLHFSFLSLSLTFSLHMTHNRFTQHWQPGLTLIIMIAVWRSLGAEEGSDGGGGGSIYHGKLVCFVQQWPPEVGWQDFTVQFSYKKLLESSQLSCSHIGTQEDEETLLTRDHLHTWFVLHNLVSVTQHRLQLTRKEGLEIWVLLTPQGLSGGGQEMIGVGWGEWLNDSV